MTTLPSLAHDKTHHPSRELPGEPLSEAELRAQGRGWGAMIFFLFFFPAFFFLCVYFPIWMGWIHRFP